MMMRLGQLFALIIIRVNAIIQKRPIIFAKGVIDLAGKNIFLKDLKTIRELPSDAPIAVI